MAFKHKCGTYKHLLREAYDKLLATIGQQKHIGPMEALTEPVGASDLNGAPIPAGPLEQTQFAAVRFWTKDVWQAYEKVAKKNKPIQVGDNEDDEATKLTGQFIENVDGSPVPKYWRLDMLKFLKKIFGILEVK